MRRLATVVTALYIAGNAAGQTVTVRGLVYDSLHARPLGGALVAIGAHTATADSSGRFAIPGIAPGGYRITAQHDAVDRLGISAIAAMATVTDGREPVTIAVPSFRGLWRLECGDHAPESDTGFVFGTLHSARRARNATVSVSWIDVAATGTRIAQKQKTMEVAADSAGSYALCGVPTTTGLTIHAVADSLESGSFDISPMDRERVVRRDLTLVSPTERRRGTFTGKVVTDSAGGPLARAEVTLVDLDRTDTTDAQGGFAFDALPPGSHHVYVRRIGYGEVEFSLDLGPDERADREIIMTRITLLDSMAIKAKPLARDEAMRVFEEHRKLGLGTFLTQDDLDKANGRSLSQMMVMFPSLVIGMDPKTQKYKASFVGRGPKSINPTRGGCPMVVYVNGVIDRDYDLNEYPPGVIAGVEYYRGPAQTPPEYAGLGSGCGVIAITLRKK